MKTQRYIKKALTFRASSIGDCLMAKYLLENIHMQFPKARLGIVVAGRGGMLRNLFAAYPWLEVVEVNRRSLRGLLKLWSDWCGSDLITTQLAGKNDGAFSFPSKVVARILTCRGEFFGFADSSRFNGLLYDKVLPIRKNISVVEYERDILRAADIAVVNKWPSFLFIKDNNILSHFKLIADRYVLVHLFAGNDSRGVSSRNRRILLLELRARLPEDIIIVISGGTEDRANAEDAAHDIYGTIVIAGNVNLQEITNIISESRGVISLDTGIGHIAAHLRKPLIILRTCMGAPWWISSQYGDTIPAMQFSREDLCTYGHKKMNFPFCLNEINMSEVATSAQRLFVSK